MNNNLYQKAEISHLGCRKCLVIAEKCIIFAPGKVFLILNLVDYQEKGRFIGRNEYQSIVTMCQTTIISRSIGRLGRRSYDRRMRVVSPFFVEKRGEMTRLCNELERLCELLHNEFSTITKADYEFFGPELKVLISTLKDLLKDSIKLDAAANDRLKTYIDDLTEMEHDIVNFRVNLQEDKEFKQTMKAIGKLDFSRFSKQA